MAERAATGRLLARVSQWFRRSDRDRPSGDDDTAFDDARALALGLREGADGWSSPASRPRPEALEQTVELESGTHVLRPIKPEDAGAFATFLARMQAPDLQFRFFTAGRTLRSKDLARYIRIDRDREMAFVAVKQGDPGHGEIAGEARAFLYPGGTTAEFAILVRSDSKRRGLGRALLSKVIGYCEASGVAELIGQIRPGNEAMITLARNCGMQVEAPAGANIAVAHLDLRPEKRRLVRLSAG